MAEDMIGVWSKKLGPFLWGRIDALDEGWSHLGKIIVCRVHMDKFGASLLFRRRQYSLFWSTPDGVA